ncbi:NADPH:quinone reductase-like Zn-dependent oxidoreductase [Silvimonas terrae]|uniref:NADPH:quinone reductase-like Zn-dependent oxidoreductase n=1 Tax=Silvimonas terrae TaxID=300266 RepID=A0A840REI2_9NEIS|nr:NADP-dependent oxidoreductase [Silvimonas terrae]MBB5190994.1 NADPH:quinone reductase-like Zn-dependent oxidoreductase [Silvimonas terrae]
MQAHRIHSYGVPETLQRDTVAAPEIKAGQVLVEVKAAGINGLDWKIREGYLRNDFALALPAILGAELAGRVVAVGDGVTRFQVGDRVMGASGVGAYAELVAIAEAQLSPIPAHLSDVEAAALPVSMLTAWQALHAAGEPEPGQTVLIQGAAGGVGSFAVQFAKAAGLTVVATASASSRDYLLGLGVDRVIDRHTERFEALASEVDLVLDLVGGEIASRSFAVLAPGGKLVSTADPRVGQQGGIFLVMQSDGQQLQQLLAQATWRSTIASVCGPADLAGAVEQNRTGHAPGKMVLDMTLAA